VAGIAAGCAAGTKYNTGLVLLAVMVAHWGKPKPMRKSAIGFVAALFLSTPGILFWTSEFWRDFGYELNHTRTGHGLVFTGTAPGFIFHWSYNLLWGMGLPLLLLVSIGACLALSRLFRQKPGKQDEAPSAFRHLSFHYVILLAFALPYYGIIAQAQVKFLRYTLPLYPVLLTLLAAEGVRLWQLGGRKDAHGPTKRSVWAYLCAGAGGVAAVYTLVYALAFDSLFTQTPPQDQAAAWLSRNASGKTIGLTTEPIPRGF
jgi:hypothetical protein